MSSLRGLVLTKNLPSGLQKRDHLKIVLRVVIFMNSKRLTSGGGGANISKENILRKNNSYCEISILLNITNIQQKVALQLYAFN